MTQKLLRSAVIGVGHLGKHHARIHFELEDVDLQAVVDLNPALREQYARQHQCEAIADYRELKDRVDLVSISVPTTAHYEVASYFIEHGVHVLVEKPITTTVEQGEALISMARKNGCILMVGQSERFNPAVAAVTNIIENPGFIEVHRLGQFTTRATDVEVILDLMIHDVDLILSWVNSEIEDIRAVGIPVLSDRIDIANARIQFKSGCTANITASRISLKAQRKIRVFQPNAYISIDCMKQAISGFRKVGDRIDPANPMTSIQPIPFRIDRVEPLKAEISAFVEAVRTGTTPPVSGEAGLKALALCLDILNEVKKNPFL